MIDAKKISFSCSAIFFIIIAGALFVRLWGLGEYDFNDDEFWHLVVANQDNLGQLISFNFEQEVHPPLSVIIWHFALKISNNQLWLRMFSIVPSLLLIPSIYIFGRDYIGKSAGYFLALLFAFGAMPIGISSTIRAYSMMMLALTWAAIFAHKFSYKKSKKYLVHYFLVCLAAIELNHAAIFIVSTLGLILLLESIKEKNKKDFVVIALMHLVLIVLVGGYSYILKNIYDFSISPLIFSNRNFIEYLSKYLTLYMWFPIGGEVEDVVTQIVTLISFLSLIITPIALIRNHCGTLLILVFVPIFVVSLADYFRFYPFTITHRNNLFLFFSVAITYAYFVQIIVRYFLSFFKKEFSEDKKYLMAFLQIIAVTALVFGASSYIIKRDVFRNISPNNLEFSIKKSDRAFLKSKLDSKDSPQNVFVTLVRNIWELRFQYGDKGHLQILTKNLGRFESEGRVIYFTAIPAREHSVTGSLEEYKLFFIDLFAQLRAEGRMDQIKYFTFFDIGLKFDYLARQFHLQLIPKPKDPFMNEADKVRYKIWQEGYDFGWVINRSDQVVDKFYLRDSKFTCGREVLIFSFTPKFVRDEILNKNFIETRQFKEEAYLNDR